ncbi:hypothetical protein PIB30_027760 [Stylosanthes scabra]|uniref:Uncharacterized protein n=1 Tax=Stylosanthes scabra TaxID=79078 RepID=A0ABU6Y9B9_9FABA|nr:hypothetical protein [Stylosanthes scabra]
MLVYSKSEIGAPTVARESASFLICKSFVFFRGILGRDFAFVEVILKFLAADSLNNLVDQQLLPWNL